MSERTIRGWETVMWVSMGVCLTVAVVVPFFRDDAVAVVVPVLMASIIGAGIAGLRQQHPRSGGERPPG